MVFVRVKFVVFRVANRYFLVGCEAKRCELDFMVRFMAIMGVYVWILSMVHMLEAVVVWSVILGMVSKPMVIIIYEIIV